MRKVIGGLVAALAVSVVALAIGSVSPQGVVGRHVQSVLAVGVPGVADLSAQEKCSVQSDAPPDTCECGPNKTKVTNPCIYCSTPSGKRCGDKRCKSCYVVCSPGNSVPGGSGCGG